MFLAAKGSLDQYMTVVTGILMSFAIDAKFMTGYGASDDGI